MPQRIESLKETRTEVELNLRNKEGLMPENEAELLETHRFVTEELNRALGEDALFSVELIRQYPVQETLF